MAPSWSRQILKLKLNSRIKNYSRNYSKESGYGKSSTSYCHSCGASPFLNITLDDVVDRAADLFGDNPAIAVPYQNINKTHIQFKRDVDKLAAGLIGLGLRKNDRIAIWSLNNYEWIVAKFAALKAGLILVCLNPAYKVAELEYSLNKVRCKALIAAENFKSLNLYEIICQAVPEILNCKPGRIHSQKIKSLQHVITLANKSLPGTHSFKEIWENDGSENVNLLQERKKTIQTDDPSTIIYTSGTTGKPKGATLSHFNLVNEAYAVGKMYGFETKTPSICLQVPLFHVFGYALGPLLTLLYGGKCVLPSEYFNATASLKSIQDESCTIAYGVPTMFFDIIKYLSDSKYNIKSLERIVIGAAPVPEQLVEKLKKGLGVEITDGYGLTETSAGVCLSKDPTDKHSGKPIGHAEVKIVDTNGCAVPINTKGEILVRSPYVFLGYWDEKEKTAEVLDSARWYHTGDVGSMDEDGNICVTGRIKDCIIRGGENVYPQEIENLLISHPAISEAYVVGVPDLRMGEEICSCVQLKANEKLTQEDVIEFCEGKISQFKIPKYVIFLNEFPKTESGKILKFKLREQCAKLLKL